MFYLILKIDFGANYAAITSDWGYARRHFTLIYQIKLMLKENQIKLTEEIIETGYKLLTDKLAFDGLTGRNENALDKCLKQI